MLINCSLNHLSTNEEKYKYLQTHKKELLSTIRCSTLCIEPISWMQIMPHHEALMWLYWVNENISLQMINTHYKTIDVKVRIATSMLNKLSCFSDYEKIRIHDNLVRNVRIEQEVLMEESLPF